MSRIEAALETLPPAQRALWPHLRGAAALGMVLYGGTAISLRLGHRPSLDFDFFTRRPLDRGALDLHLPFLSEATVLQQTRDTLTVLTQPDEPTLRAVKVSFFGEIDFGRVDTPQWTTDGIAEVASLLDLMATKVKTILQRIEAKDYRDIAAMIRAGVDLSLGLAAARTLFGPAFQPAEALKALAYFEGGDLHELPRADRETLIGAVREIRNLPKVPQISQELSAQ